MTNSFKKTALFIAVILLFLLLYQFGKSSFLNLSYLQNHLSALKMRIDQNPVYGSIIFFLLYAVLTAISLPGATVLTLLAGALFGVARGTLIVLFAATLGATGAMLLSRFFFSEAVKKKFPQQVDHINKNMSKSGTFYLLTLRLIPVFPFFVINLVLGLTDVNVLSFAVVSFIGMLPATLAYVYAGLTFSKITSLTQLLSGNNLLVLFLLGALPFLFKGLLNKRKELLLYRKFSRPLKFEYDIVIIGAGAAGLSAAYLAQSLKAKVALIEQAQMGGDCLNHGCIPSKSLIKSANALSLKKKAGELGLKNVVIEFDFKEVMQRVHRIIETIAPNDSIERYQKLGVHCLSGAARIISPFIVEVNHQKLTTRKIIIATGSRPNLPELPGLETVPFLTSDTLWQLQTLPERLLILGGGPIGCEMAQCFNRLGSKVTLIDSGERLLKKEDPDVSSFLEKRFRDEGIEIYFHEHPLSFGHETDFFLECHGPAGIRRFSFDKVLLATGRKAQIEELGLSELGIELNANKTILINEFGETTLSTIYACGDVSGPYQFTHMSSYQASVCVLNALFGFFKKTKLDYSVVSWCTFTDPEIATVGLNETEAKKSGLEFEVTIYHMAELDRALTDSEHQGFVKVLTKKGSDKILGATVVAVSASTLILEWVMAMKKPIGLRTLLQTIHPYPSFGEANKFVAGKWQQNHLPHNLIKWLQRFFSWRRG